MTEVANLMAFVYPVAVMMSPCGTMSSRQCKAHFMSQGLSGYGFDVLWVMLHVCSGALIGTVQLRKAEFVNLSSLRADWNEDPSSCHLKRCQDILSLVVTGDSLGHYGFAHPDLWPAIEQMQYVLAVTKEVRRHR